ncbi:FtsQ-type POTRA domain-containing protein [Wolbachia endosymbiont of Brugia malayi]|uniref:cell division protein FtsQ/DivIB n=1 Tax=Wolbachia endosymbiont of Brugia malayi TaxID=80849 RepID=UPI00004C9447|nr:cell division protein FtsQ/DivIB [Wolbachia endosymbiont of Brugia malayi]AAW71159.1 Cell division septal protein [Wolbachia endosymbiont strain TRS of Brugia malayi]QCB61359.1 FtsQ-type POTRA domain-containing protein [Wolbachia endosymbiont of Brugia malayi]
MLSNITRSQRSFLHKCALVIITALFFTLVFYSSLDKITSRFNHYLTWCNDYLSSLLLSSGFSIDEVVVNGNKFTNEKDILNLVNKTQPIIYISPSKLADSIQSVSKWIKHVRIHRILPNTLYINVDEHKPFALWKDNNKTSVIDSEGKVIVDDYPTDNFIVITGQNALSNLKFIKDILESKTQLSDHISSCIYVENRRWNIILDNGSTVKLPEDDPHSAWNYLNHLQNTTDFTFSDWSIIDMRIIDKIFIKR